MCNRLQCVPRTSLEVEFLQHVRVYSLKVQVYAEVRNVKVHCFNIARMLLEHLIGLSKQYEEDF